MMIQIILLLEISKLWDYKNCSTQNSISNVSLCGSASTFSTRNGSSLLQLFHAVHLSASTHHRRTAKPPPMFTICFIPDWLGNEKNNNERQKNGLETKPIQRKITVQEKNHTLTIAGLSLLDIFTGRKWRFGIFSCIADISGNLWRQSSISFFYSVPSSSEGERETNLLRTALPIWKRVFCTDGL